MGGDRAALDDSVARSLDAGRVLLPWLDFLLGDLEELGGEAREVLELLRPLALPPGTRALDLGCGKGAVALALARELGWEVLGVDGFEPFVRRAAERARASGLETRARFEVDDLAHFRPSAPFDCGLLIGVAGAIGGLAPGVAHLRRCVKPGGWLLIDDAFAGEGSADRAATHAELIAHGDALVVERIVDRERESEINARNTALIRGRAQELARERPELRLLLEAYVAAQECESERACREVLSATWLLRRGP